VRLLASLLALVGLAYGLTRYPLLDPDEGRNAEVGREMTTTHDYVLPTLDGLPYVDKPVLFFAVEAAFMAVLGPTALAARLPSLLFTLGTVGAPGSRRSPLPRHPSPSASRALPSSTQPSRFS
jgi:4-amino-4-deoxy-L-arabinose transferase-like glycosyltransferase